MSILDKIEVKNELLGLIQKENFIGWIYSIDYEKALVISNDEWKHNVKGIPHNSFLIATSFSPDQFGSIDEDDRQVVLLRVNGSAKLPQDDEMIKTKIDGFEKAKSMFDDGQEAYDVYTKSRMQFNGIDCRVLGTFYIKNEELVLGSDIETFYSSLKLNVYMPKGEALEKIVNYVDPIRKKSSKSEYAVEPFKIGTVRYTSTDRLHRGQQEMLVPFNIQPSDFLARRTAVLGMTRTGKSNMIKQTISVVKDISYKCNIKIGQLIYDINGEYANANEQDKGSIADIYGDECVRYSMMRTEGFLPLLTNFYEQIEEGFQVICDVLNSTSSLSNDLRAFKNISFYPPDPMDNSAKCRYTLKLAIYKALLKKSNFETKGSIKIYFKVAKDILDRIKFNVDPNQGITLEQAIQFFEKARLENLDKEKGPILNSSKNEWLDSECKTLLNILAGFNDLGTPIFGFKALYEANKYHTPDRSTDVANEIYKYLLDGKIVILDLSVGHAVLRENISKKLAKYIFDQSMETFTNGKSPSNIVIYIEEAHNLIGKEMKLVETWPRLAKEGAKYKIALVYATQEVSSVHPNILANTENWFVTHLNSEKEINELAKFYDFVDFKKSLLRSQDVGFARVKTLSSPFVIPIQIDKFDPERIKAVKSK